MNNPPLILVADDSDQIREILATRLRNEGYLVATARNGEEVLTSIRQHGPDLLLLDVMMPDLNGNEVCFKIRNDSTITFFPIIMVTVRSDAEDVIAGLKSGADEYVSKPVDQHALIARIRSMLKIKELYDTVQEQSQKLRSKTQELAVLNRSLEDRVSAQITELDRIRGLSRFLPPQVAEILVATENETILDSHRSEVSVVFCDLRGFTEFAESNEPEEVMDVLQQYHQHMGDIITRYNGTLARFAGDGIVVFFNDPLPLPNHTVAAAEMSKDMRTAARELTRSWAKRGHVLGFGIGIAVGYATLGRIGSESRAEYTAIGTVCNISSRLCDMAKDQQILITDRVRSVLGQDFESERIGTHKLRGIRRPIMIYNLT